MEFAVKNTEISSVVAHGNPALGRLRQEDDKSDASLGNLPRPCVVIWIRMAPNKLIFLALLERIRRSGLVGESVPRGWALRFQKLNQASLSLPAASRSRERTFSYVSNTKSTCVLHDGNGLNPLKLLASSQEMLPFFMSVAVLMVPLHSNRTRTKTSCLKTLF